MRNGWTDEYGRPADLTVDYDVNLRNLGRCMAQVVPVKSGRLRKAVLNVRNYRYDKRRKTIRMEIADVPYAKYTDTGGQIPTRFPVRAKAMHWIQDGVHIFTKRARGYYYQGIGWVENGFLIWLSKGQNENIRIYWGRRRR